MEMTQLVRSEMTKEKASGSSKMTKKSQKMKTNITMIL